MFNFTRKPKYSFDDDVEMDDFGAYSDAEETEEVEEEIPAPAAPVAAGPVNGEKVLSPFPGLIKNLLVAEGASVIADAVVSSCGAVSAQARAIGSIIARTRSAMIMRVMFFITLPPFDLCFIFNF